MTPEQKKQIEEINLHIREALRQWSDVCLTADADEWAVHLRYFPSDLMNATLIFQHVASSIGIHAGRIDEHTACEVTTTDLRRLCKGGTHLMKMDSVAALVDATYLFDLSEGRVTE